MGNYADGGWALAAYPSTTEVDSYLGITSATPSTSCTSCRHNESTTDNLGRSQYQYLVNDPDGETSMETSYDANSRTSSVTTPYRGSSTGQDSYSYDGLDRITTLTHADGTAISTYYGLGVGSHGGNGSQLCSSATYGIGYPALVIDEAGKKREAWTDAFGRTIEVDEPDSSNNLTKNTCYQHDLNNNLTQVVSATTQTRTYQYDALSRLTSISTPETNVSGTQYSSTHSYTTSGGVLCSGNPSAVCVRTDARGKTTTYSYDALNRLTTIQYSDSTPTVTYCYDGNNSSCITGGYSSTHGQGRRTAMSDGSGNTGWGFDKVGRISTEQRTIAGVTKTISYTYDLDGSVATLTYPSGRVVSYNIGNAERPLSAIDSNGTQYATSAEYSPAGAVASMVYGKVTSGFGGMTEQRQYNSRLETTSVAASSSSGTALNLAYCFTGFTFSGGCSSSATNNNGNVTGITNSVDSNENQIFSYDNLNRISTAATEATSGSDCWGQSFAGGIDQVANLTGISVTQCSPTSLSVGTDGYNHLTAAGFSYDNSGDMTGDGLYSYSFDAEQRMTSANGVSYVYDGDGLRVKKSSGTLDWRSIWGDTIAETDLSGNTVNEYVFLNRRVARVSSSGTVNYFQAEPLGTIHTIANANGNPCYDATFTPYGEEMVNPSVSDTCPSNYKYDGYELDPETGLYYDMGRYYNPRLGRFMSADPVSGDGIDPQSMNLYSDVMNEPTVLCDPSGLNPVPCPLVIAGTTDSKENSAAILDFARSIQANVVFPKPSIFTTADEGDAATEAGIAASSGPLGGPSSVFAYSIGGSFYNSVPNPGAGIVEYVMPYFGGSSNPGSAASGTSATFVLTGTGIGNALVSAASSAAGGTGPEGAQQIASLDPHQQTSIFPDMQSNKFGYMPFTPGPHCTNPQVFQAGSAPTPLNGSNGASPYGYSVSIEKVCNYINGKEAGCTTTIVTTIYIY
jgi:RHS repeat-associated protein